MKETVAQVIMEARVPEAQWDALKRAYAYSMQRRPAGVISSSLMQDIHDKEVWRISTVWESHQAAMALYDAGATMPSMYAFHLIGVVPDISISDVVDQV